MRSIAIGIAFSAALIGTPAFAADIAAKAPPANPVPVNSWAGFYVGANAGYGWGKSDVGYSPNDPAAASFFSNAGAFTGATPIPTSFNTSGALGGIELGYNWQVEQKWVLGLETDFDWSGIKGSSTATGTLVATGAPFTVSANQNLEWFGTVRARAGYLPADNLLTFVTGGFAYGRVSQSGNYVNDNPGLGSIGNQTGGFIVNCGFGVVTCFTGSSSKVVPGWTAGSGFEYAILKNVTVKAEYLYVSLNAKSTTETNLTPPGGFTPGSFNANFNSMGINILRVGANYRF